MVEEKDKLVLRLRDEFIELRKSGKNRDDSWFVLINKARDLNSEQVEQLLRLSKKWEMREGHRYRSPDDSAATFIATPKSSVRESIKDALSENQNQVDNPEEATAEIPRSILDEVIRQVKKSSLADEANNAASPDEDLTHFPSQAKLKFSFPDFPNILIVEIPSQTDIIIGRATLNAVMVPDIDLTVVHAGFYGVSRIHAVFLQHDNILFLSDLGSANQTFVNGIQLQPHEPHILKRGDTIHFARLAAQIDFQHD